MEKDNIALLPESANSKAELIADKKRGTIVTVEVNGRSKEFMLEELDETRIDTLRSFLKFQARALREKILDGVCFWGAGSVWDEWKRVNEQLDVITNFLVCRQN